MLSFIFCVLSSVVPIDAPNISYWTEECQRKEEDHKPSLCAYVGPSWCPWSQKFIEEILTNSDFIEPLKDTFTLVWQECPSAEKAEVAELPLLILKESSGEEIARMGYLLLPPAEFANRLKAILTIYQELKAALQKPSLSIDELEKFYTQAMYNRCAQLQKQFLEIGMQRDEGSFFILEKYTALVNDGLRKSEEALRLRQKILERDPQNVKGAYRALALLHFHAISQRRRSPKQIVKPLTDYLEKFGEQDSENRWKIEWVIAQFFFTKKKMTHAINHAEASYAAAPESVKPQLAPTLDYLKSKSHRLPANQR